MQVISTWAVIDSVLSVLATTFLRSDFEVVTGMLQALTGNESRRAAIVGAAQSALKPKDFALFCTIMKVIKPSRDRRNDFAHHNWGYFSNLDDAIVLADPKCFVSYDARRRAVKARRRRHISPIDYTKILVFRRNDLEEEVEAANTALHLVLSLKRALSRDKEAAKARSELLIQPQVRQALARMTSGSAPTTRRAPKRQRLRAKQ
jgi:hypothetical protein